MANISEHLVKTVIQNKPKMLIGLNQKVRGQAWGSGVSPNMGVAPPVERVGLNWIKSVKRNMVSPMPSSKGVRRSQDRMTGQWVKEDGESEGSSVMREIEVEHRAILLHTKVGRLPSGSCLRDNLINLRRLESR
jgi:hypothetical protein